MSIKVMTWVWEHAPCKGTQLLALLALADFSNDEGESYPGTKYLAKKTRVGTTSLHQILHGLEVTQQIGIWNGKGISANGGITNRYFVNGYRISVGLQPVYSSTHGETKQQQQKRKTFAEDTPVHTGVEGIHTGVQPPVHTGVHKPSENPSVKDSSVVPQPELRILEKKKQPGKTQSGGDQPVASPGKKARKKTETAPAVQLDMDLKAAVEKCFSVGESSAFQITHVLSGTYTKRPELNVHPAVTIDELRGFYTWWKKKNIDFPKNPQSVQDAVTGWRASGDYQAWRGKSSADIPPASPTGNGKSGSLNLIASGGS